MPYLKILAKKILAIHSWKKNCVIVGSKCLGTDADET